MGTIIEPELRNQVKYRHLVYLEACRPNFVMTGIVVESDVFPKKLENRKVLLCTHILVMMSMEIPNTKTSTI